MEALATGHKGIGRQDRLGNRGHFGLDELASGGLSNPIEEGEVEVREDEDDDEELQAQLIKEMISRVRGQKEETAVDELTDEEAEGEEGEEGDGNQFLN